MRKIHWRDYAPEDDDQYTWEGGHDWLHADLGDLIDECKDRSDEHSLPLPDTVLVYRPMTHSDHEPTRTYVATCLSQSLLESAGEYLANEWDIDDSDVLDRAHDAVLESGATQRLMERAAAEAVMAYAAHCSRPALKLELDNAFWEEEPS